MLVRVSRARADMHLRTFICLLFLAIRRFSSGQIIGCPRGQWQCDDGHCITDAWRCDGQGDCLDGSDEMDCEASGGFGCPPGQFACEDSVGCVDASARCDGRNQCPTGSDEENCLATEGCLDSEWMCRNRVCIPTELRCNRKNDCGDNSDEQDCGLCSAEGVRCPDGTCLSPEERCDGQIHCSDGSDEPITCGRICSMNNGGCSHVCTDEIWGARCSCPVGLKLSPDGAVCEDLDECASPFPPCVHHCANTVGSFYCHCRVGFKLVGSSKCLASGNATRLLTVQKNAVGLLNVKSQHFNIIKALVLDPVALAYDITRGYFYWADRDGNIFKSNGQQSWTTFSGEPGIKGLACDWLNGYLFWTNQKTQSIYMQSADGASYTTLLNKNISPSELVVLPVESSMFWINVGPGDRVTLEKSWMDGSDRGTLAVLTAQVAHSLTADVAARRLYWISGFKRSIETVKVDGTGRFSFTGMFNRRPARSLAVFESVFYWVDDKGLWQVPQSQPSQRKFIWKTELPQLVVYHELQQPKGPSVCAKMSCDLCQLTKSNPVGFTCACPYFKVLLPDGMCEFPRFLYATIATINLLEFRGSESSETQLFTTDEGILSFDVDWYRDWLYWANRTGHIQRSSLTQDKVELIPAPLPVCLINVDQRNGNLFWVSCDQNSIGTITAGSNYPQQLYRTTKEIRSLYLDWLRGGMFWLEDKQIFSMDLAEGKAKELLEMTGGVGNLAFDLRASSLLWNSKRAGLTTLSLLKERSHQAGRRWNISGSVVAAFEPFLLSYSNEVITLWDLRDGTNIASVTVRDYVLNVIVVLGDIQIEPETPECNAPSLLCRRSSICILQTQFCDGKRDCPDGDDEDFCVATCSSKDEFKCKDSRSCIPIRLVCDGRSHCHDGSDEASCPTEAAPLTRSNNLKCRSGSKLCADGTECVLYSHVCDGEMDCRDGSDEVGCDEPKENVDKLGSTSATTLPPAATLLACLSPSVLCPSAHICISPDQFCNGIKDCPDGFDEKNCIKSCPLKNDFLCKDRLSCLSKSLVCDGRSHCSDGSDEVNCPNLVPNAPRRKTKCPFGSRSCRDGTGCVLLGHVCDGQRDCPDGSDEECGQNLSKAEEILTTIPPTTPPCTSPSVLCPGSSVCIKQTQMCDRKRDCPDGFDEKCIKRCPSATDFRCKDRRSCVKRSQMCDGRSHCHDGSDELNCQSPAAPETPTKVLKCRFGSKSCRDGTGCVLLSHVCDGERDCPDGSDEEECAEGVSTSSVDKVYLNESLASLKLFTEPPTTPPCTSPSVLCPGTSICIKQTQMCDKRRDCPDGFDEKCVKRCPSAAPFRCKDRRSCVKRSQVCDGRSHCHDGSDELNCQSPAAPETPTKILKCRFGSKSCRDGTGCVLLSHVCDGERDCPDGSDEEGCDDADGEPAISGENQSSTKAPAPTEKLPEPPTTPPCTSPSVLCPGSSICIKQTQMCDGRRDCPDGFDEKCIKRCPSATDFRCKDRRSCVKRSQVCDGRSHCHDGSDELNCQSPAAPETPTKILKCRFGSKSCRDGTGCVLLSHVCDGERDCPDGSDEEECDDADNEPAISGENQSSTKAPAQSEKLPEPPTTPPCTSPSVLCPGSSVCIKQTQMCDGKRDCPDGFDEKCIKRCPSATDFRCKDRRSCVKRSQVCDGRSHCHDGSDELNCQSPAAPETPTKILKCRFGSKSCRDGTGCVLLSHVCDGERDCPDGSDEEGCDDADGEPAISGENQSLTKAPAPTEKLPEPPTTPPCTSPSVLCPGSSVCIKQTQMCDGKRDCPDGFDEKCIKRCPSATDFRCKDRRSCVQRSQVCDGRSHCHDGSDEFNCQSPAAPETPTKVLKCRFGSKSCRDGTGCVLLSHVCDGERDCPDGSDEEECAEGVSTSSVDKVYLNESLASLKLFTEPPTTPPCTSPSVLCPGTSICIKQTQMCDKRRDCPDGFDEKCVKRCPSAADFRCKDRRSCVKRSQVCDGRSHCHDGSDEFNCQSPAAPETPTKILKCRFGSKSCRDGTGCVLLSHVCDGERDCPDGSDEEGCDDADGEPAISGENQSLTKAPAPSEKLPEPPTTPPCTSPSVLCPGSSICIKQTQMCDKRRDCPDGFDEKCVKRCPSAADFRCKDRRSCVKRSQVCDGRSHCHDGSDELNCQSPAAPETPTKILKCRFGSKSCRDGTGCVLLSHVCDGERDCPDGSDEEGCDNAVSSSDDIVETKDINESPTLTGKLPEPPTTPPCTSPSVLCPGSSVCIKPTQMCDRKRDCPDGFDEKCVRRCPSSTDFRCKDRRSCVPRKQVCDGRSHCHDGSDEADCPNVALPAAQDNVLKCRTGAKLCRDGTECVLFSHVCDGEKDCQDGSDEDDCAETTESPSLTSSPCSFPSVQCPSSTVCIDPSQLCDGVRNCPDGSDEICVKRCADKTDFLCKDRRRCVSRTLVCDGRSHCYDASDEANCPRVTPPPSRSVLKCRMGSKPCDDGKECVLFSHVCDGEMDCLDGSDERGCQETCEGEFQCAHGKKCIPQAEVCDGKFQCQDQSDEQDCWEKTKSCEHRCADGKRCIPKKFLCDGEQDCLDGSDEVGCDSSPATTEIPLLTSPPPCITPSVLCPGSFKCISQYQLCDGQKDCPDGFDEKDCVVRCENPDDFLCSDQRKCIPQTQVCDGRAQCPDGSDEKRCQSEDLSATSNKAPSTRPVALKCRTGFKPCKNGLECVMYSHVCDGEMDCQDGSDEEGCESLCKAGEFLCSHGRKCIPQEQVCDGRSDCQDRSDELDCSIRSEGCSRRCDNNTRCLPQTFLCDGERDCIDASDEENCGVVACAAQQYRCASGQCVSEALRCDGYPDCRDRSDEMDCARPPRCPVELRCPHSHECLQKEWLCDGEDDCKDGSDEKNCNNPPAKCRKHQFQCGDDSQCVPLSWRCDGKEDCSNRMDEDKCSQRKCPFHLYQCGSRECLDPKLVCNGFTNCADGSDEGVGCAQRNCSSPSAPLCDFRCVSTPNGPRCYCGAGFRLQSSSRSCMDIDECSSSGALCKHICQNTPGSYSCLCHPGFYLEPDNRSCKTKDEPLLLASVQTELLILGVHSGKTEILSSVDRPVFSLDYDLLQQRVYWLSPDYQSVRWAGMRSSNKGTLIKGVKSNSLAVDWVGRNLYWVDGLVGQILAAKLINSTMRSQDYAVVLSDNLEQPSSLVLLPERGLMLWSEIGNSPQIERAGMDGSQRKVVVSRDLSWPVGLAFDFLDNRLFWADEKLRCIGSASLDGDDIKILQLAETPSPFSVAVFNDRVFWSDTKRRTVRSADKKTGKDQKVLLKRPGQPFGLKLMHALSQPAASSPCELIRCSHLCLLAPPVPGQSGPAGSPAAVCRCPKGLLLSEDRMTCSLPKESAFILLLFRDSVHQIYLRSMRRDGSALKKMPNGRDFALPGVKEALSLDLFIPQLLLFVAYSNHGSVDVMRLSSSKSNPKLVVAEPILKLEKDSVTTLAVDWVTANVYWSSVEKPDIHVTSHFGGHTTSLLHGSLLAVSSIALHPSTGRLCYTAVVMTGATGEAGVDCAWMDGRNTVVLWRKSSIPISLVFSDAGTRIYWADTGEGVISSIGVDGSGYREYKTGPNLLVSFTRIENIFLWVTRDKDVSKLWFSDGRQPKQLWFETKNAVVELRSYNNETQAGSNSCSSNNGGCDHLCLPYPGGRTCKCGRGFYIIGDTSCTPLPSCPLGEESCSDGSKCINSSQLCDGRVDCPNGSDEENCVISDSTSSDTKEHDDSPLSLQPNPQKNSVPSDDLESCDLERCSGHGNCVMEGQSIHCQCLPAYKGESCQELNRKSHPAVIMVAFCLVSAVVVAGFVFTKRKGWECFRRSSEKDPLMAHMALPEQDSDTEESPVDVRNPLQTVT